MDLWDSYKTSADSTGYLLSDLLGREVTSSDPNLIAIWRKPFVRITSQKGENPKEDFAREQLRVYLRSMSHDLSMNGKLRLVNPYLEMSFSKLVQLRSAEEFFSVPGWEFKISDFPLESKKMVVKPIGYPMLSNGKTVFTNLVLPRDLEQPFPWLFQEPIIEGMDVTCVFIDEQCHWYESTFQRLPSSIDWRREIQTEKESPWVKIPEQSLLDMTKSVRNFMRSSNLKYGRLDFIRDGHGIFWFLECNVNGEFGWLDDAQETMHHVFLDAIFKSS